VDLQGVSVLKSWRELLATPLPEVPKGDGEIVPGDVGRTQIPQIPQIPDSLRVDLHTDESANRPQIPPETLPRQRLIQTGPNTWVEAEWARGLCVFCDRPSVDVIACPEHRAKIDAIVMPWSEPS
jgi:hypothetical protein